MSVPIVVVQGAQWGSEGKGMVAAAICAGRGIQYAVRTGSVNAGHTVYYNNRAYKMQQIPTGWVNPRTQLVIGAGAFIHPEILLYEIEMINRAMPGKRVQDRLFIDKRASLHLQDHTDQSMLSGRHHRIGATGKGCSVALTDKISKRGAGYQLFREWWEGMYTPGQKGPTSFTYDTFGDLKLTDTVELLNGAYDTGASILLEGTQGSLLDLHLGPYPYTTHKQTQAMQWAAEAGLALGLKYEVLLVARTYPIRVAGNSGPMPKETTWVEVAREINKRLRKAGKEDRVSVGALSQFEAACKEVAESGKYDLPLDRDDQPMHNFERWPDDWRVKYQVAISELHRDALDKLPAAVVSDLCNVFEMTTVTKKLRRVAKWDYDSVRWSVMVNRPDGIVVSFLNYMYPELWDSKNLDEVMGAPGMKGSLVNLQTQLGVPIVAVTTGARSEHYIEVPAMGAYAANR